MLEGDKLTYSYGTMDIVEIPVSERRFILIVLLSTHAFEPVNKIVFIWKEIIGYIHNNYVFIPVDIILIGLILSSRLTAFGVFVIASSVFFSSARGDSKIFIISFV